MRKLPKIQGVQPLPQHSHGSGYSGFMGGSFFFYYYFSLDDGIEFDWFCISSLNSVCSSIYKFDIFSKS